METPNIPTAEEFLIEKGVANPIGETWRLDLSRDCYVQTEKDIHRAMIEFAKLHVQAALEAAKEIGNDFEGNETMNESILNSYPLDSIK